VVLVLLCRDRGERKEEKEITIWLLIIKRVKKINGSCDVDQ